MNPYETDPALIPVTDPYADVPAYGRYRHREDDFRPDPKHFMSTSTESLEYWSSVLDLCNESSRMVEGYEGGRDVFALGSVVIKSSHLNPERQGRRASRDHSYSDANEVAATRLVKEMLPDVRVPQIYFAGKKIGGFDVLVQERIPGVALAVAWRYLTSAQKASFKEQARDLLRKLQKIQPLGQNARSYLVPDADPVGHRGIEQLEYDMIFSEDNKDSDISFMHNDFNQSNCIVDDDKIVALVDWEMAGYFGWKTAGQVHATIRCPQAAFYSHLDPPLPPETLDDILFWNDLYDV